MHASAHFKQDFSFTQTLQAGQLEKKAWPAGNEFLPLAWDSDTLAAFFLLVLTGG